MLRIDELCKSYRRRPAVTALSLELPPGRVCGFVGPNGAGKTTTMRCVAGLIAADRGSIHIDDHAASGIDPDYKRRVVYVPDDPPLMEDLTVGDHMELVGRLYDRPDHHDRTETLLRQFELWDRRDAGGGELSRGMRQKLAICCAALASPRLLLLDEPMTGLDPPGIRQLLQLIRDWTAGTDDFGTDETGTDDIGTDDSRSQRRSVIISSHLLAMIADVCTDVLVMADGRQRFFGTTDQMRQQYPGAATLEDAYFAATTDAGLADATATGTVAPIATGTVA